MKKAVIITPSYNEKENLKKLIPLIFHNVKRLSSWSVSILVVDDNSPDGTADVVRELQKQYPRKLHLIEGKKEGLGKAYRRGFTYALDTLSPDVVFEMDADLQHDPKLIPAFLAEIDRGAEFVIGSRYIKGGGIPKEWEWYRKVFSIGASVIIPIGFMKLSIRDWTSGFRAIRADFLKKTLPLYKGLDGYVFQIGILYQAVKNGLEIREIPMQFIDRKAGKSKITSFGYIFEILKYIVLNSSFVRFAFVGLIGAAIDFGGSFILIEIAKWAVWVSTAISSEIAIICNFLINNFWSFSYKRIKGGPAVAAKAFINFNLVSLGNIIIQTVLMFVATEIFPKEYWYVYKTVIIGLFIIPYSYIMYNLFIWRDKKI